MHFFKAAYTTAKLSPYFLFKALCGFSILNDIRQDPIKSSEGVNDRNLLRFLLARRFILPSVKLMQNNYLDYRHVLQLIDKHGYQRKWAKFFLSSTCGRNQLKTACKERGCLDKYDQHIKDAGVKWYRIDSDAGLNRMFKIDPFVVSRFTLMSRPIKENTSTPEAVQVNCKRV